MPSSHKEHRKHRSPSSSSSSSSEQERRERRRCRERRERKHRSKSSSSSSSSDKKCSKKSSKKCSKKSSKKCSKKSSKKHSKECSKKSSKKCSKKSQLECYSNDDELKKHHKHYSKSSSSSSSSDSSHYKIKFKLCDIYTYFKNRLLEDKELMVAGSSAYLTALNDQPQIISPTHSAKFNTTLLNYNIDRYPTGASVFPREDGVYILFFITNTDSASQFTIFINNQIMTNTCVGTNSGAGQLVSRHMLKLRKDDNIVVRNYISPNSVKSNIYVGGLLAGNDMTYLMMKVAPYDEATVDVYNKEHFMKSLSCKKKKLFDRLTTKLLCDKELMVRGFDIHGTFYNRDTQVVNTEAAVVFNESNVANGLVWNPLYPTQVVVTVDGVYKLFFLVTTTTAAQFTIFINGLPIDSTTQGTNRGASQLTLRTLLELRAGDVITVNNHTSPNSGITVSEYAGGFQHTISTILTVFKIAPLYKPCILPVDCKLVKHYECEYLKLREYLLYNDCLQLGGSPSYLSATSVSTSTVPINDLFHWSTNIVQHQLAHTQGADNIVVEKSGVYDIFGDIITEQSLQYTLFINGVPDLTTIFGRDSGAARCLMRQMIKLNKGDVLTLRNYESSVGTVTTAENPGGSYVGQSSMFMIFLLSPDCVLCPPKAP